MTTTTLSRRFFYLLAACIIALQAVLLVFTIRQKQEFHIDEIYSFILSNSYDTNSFNNADWMWGTWVDQTDFDEFATVQQGEQFAYPLVYRNNSLDAHPPLYYWMLHTVSSFFPGRFDKWIGCLPNVVCFAVTGLFLLHVSERLMGRRKMALLPLLLYGFSLLAVDTVLFIRMYALLTLFAVIFLDLHVSLYQDGFRLPVMGAVFLVIFLGTYTQYYFAFLSFWGVLFTCFYLLYKKDFKTFLLYGFGALFAILLVVATYPAVFSQVLGQESNNVGSQIMANLFNIPLFVKQTVVLTGMLLSRQAGSLTGAVVFCGLMALITLGAGVALLRSGDLKEHLLAIPFLLWWMFAVIILTALTVAFIGGEFVYTRYVYYLVPWIFLLLTVYLEDVFVLIKAPAFLLPALLIAFTAVSAPLHYRNQACEYLFTADAAVDRALSDYSDLRGVVVVRRGSAVPTGNFTKLRQMSAVYMNDYDSLLEEDVIRSTLEEDGRLILWINTDTYWTEGYDAGSVLNDLVSRGICTNFTKLANSSLCEIYLLESEP